MNKIKFPPIIPKKIKTFKPTLTEKTIIAKARKNLLRGNYMTLQALEESLKEYSRGDGAGPFTAKQAKKFLRNL